MKKVLKFIIEMVRTCYRIGILAMVFRSYRAQAGLILWTFGFKIYAGFAFGVFATRNWDIVKGLFKK